jgi:hypothetical protein
MLDKCFYILGGKYPIAVLGDSYRINAITLKITMPRMMTSPYNTIPSKKGIFPKGVLKRHLSSEILGKYRQIMAKKTRAAITPSTSLIASRGDYL